MDKQHLKIIIKTITWRLIALIITMLVYYLFHRDFTVALNVGLWANFIKTFFYYFHEHAWNLVKWGKKKSYDLQRRTLVKTVSWKVIATTITMLVALSYTSNLAFSLGIGFAVNLIKAVFYYLHERVWNKIGLKISNGTKHI